ncbi:MAG: hypothetical protein QOE89_1022 [Pseudonocardiales bacterium]|jgi:hypothetical protein|nr:hypothetical protein [Pseudonocardiales bacterium]
MDDLYADFLPQMVGADGVIRGPAGVSTYTAIAGGLAKVTRDLAELAGHPATSLAELVDRS